MKIKNKRVKHQLQETGKGKVVKTIESKTDQRKKEKVLIISGQHCRCKNNN